ncbi:MAG: histidine kinase dimerization/phospho-acceptor domain-containing protein [Bdellovibrio sp.]
MITGSTVFRRNYFIFVSIVIVFIFMAFGSAWLVDYLDRPTTQVRIVRPPNTLFRNIYNQLDKDPLIAFKKLQEANSDRDNFMKFELVDRSGQSLNSGKMILPRPLNQEEVESLATDKNIRFGDNKFGPPKLDLSKTRFSGVYFVHMFSPPPGFFSPPPPGGPNMGPPPPPPPHGMKPPPGPRRNLMLITIGFLVIFTLVSVGIAMVYQFSRYRERANEALTILNDLRHGNLSARMSTKKFEELGPLVTAFNHMADDVESMVESLRKADHARRQLLQDLAHDLRTPLASLQTFLETMQTSNQKLTEEKRQEVISLCFYEVEYFGKLVEDLLFLAQITEPKYSAGTEEINLLERVQDQVTVFKNRFPNLNYEIAVSEEAKNQNIIGSSKLIDRLLRNAFENSSSFAKGKVRVELQNDGAFIDLNVIDDGPGFSESSLKEFGYKKASRILSDSSNGKRISVGIGSVIMREILQIHSGELQASNLVTEDKILGGKVSFRLPKV